MSQIMSKMAPIGVSCYSYVHPWTESCAEASCGLFVWAIYDSLRIYGTVYILALLMKGRIPTLQDVKKTFYGILQSTAFLSFTAFGYSMFLCILRKVMGHYNIFTVSFVPSFLSSVLAILIERPSRRSLLALYVSNVATETLWNMARARELVRPIRYGPVLIFSGSMAILLAYYKAGCHKAVGEKSDSMFNILKFIIGPYEERGYTARVTSANDSIHRRPLGDSPNESASCRRLPSGSRTTSTNPAVKMAVSALRCYKQTINTVKCGDRHHSCPHPFGCVFYTLQGTFKMFSIGFALQFGVKTLFNMKTLFKSPSAFLKVVLRRDILAIGSFLGGSCGLFRSIMCISRRITGTDSPYYAIPAGLIAGLAFTNYPDTTVALYVFWKMLQITYNMGIERGVVPEIPGFTVFLYCFSTAILFHAALVEPMNLRPSYWKFLISISGGRVGAMKRDAMDVWGLETSQNLAKLMTKTRTTDKVKYFFFK